METECFFNFDIFEIHSDNFLGGGYADRSWKFKVFDLFFMFLKYVFFVFILDAIFCGTIFFSFLRTVCG